MVVKEIKVKNVLTKSNLPVSDYSVNPYVGCSHSCKYCRASLMKRFTNHPEEWGTFVDVKYWEKIKSLRQNEIRALICLHQGIFYSIVSISAKAILEAKRVIVFLNV